MNAKDAIRENLRHYLKAAGRTQLELADHLDITPSAVSNWMRGKNSIDVEYVPAICDFLGISVNQLFNGDKQDTTEITYYLLSLDEETRAEVYDFIRFKLGR